MNLRSDLDVLIDGQVRPFSTFRKLWDSNVLIFVKGALLIVLWVSLLTLHTKFTPFANPQFQLCGSLLPVPRRL